ncbi:serine/threonine-protein kinase TAO3-like isoform X2 [Megalobrama amblycephala]|uniref:serine/threonine-protein kinase TAO3-like isoform X2 n=1 Tax=Megalobrama amblycephala TaxID=75352 RepID=UPI002013DF58|nr:serine/threonine-protein kinase TAO3-like isoform X2 [Megalobrama amblycephala]
MKTPEKQIKKQFQDTCGAKQAVQSSEEPSEVSPKSDHKAILKSLKEEQTRKLAQLAEQYEQSINQMMTSHSIEDKLVSLHKEWTEKSSIYLSVRSENWRCLIQRVHD